MILLIKVNTLLKNYIQLDKQVIGLVELTRMRRINQVKLVYKIIE
jgi:hypothetical protein